jgi:hypothetical protein
MVLPKAAQEGHGRYVQAPFEKKFLYFAAKGMILRSFASLGFLAE